MDKQREDSIVEMMTLAQRLNNITVGMQVRKAQVMSGATQTAAEAINKARCAAKTDPGSKER